MTYTNFDFFGDASCGIYLIKNLINDRVYIGQTTRRFVDRWNEHIRLAKCDTFCNSSLISKAIGKYGIDNFDFVILEQCQADQLDVREKYWIALFSAGAHDNYNRTAGGQNAALATGQPDVIKLIVNLLATSEYSIKEIAEQTNISIDAIYAINSGKHYYNSSLAYPIRQLTGNNKVVQSIIKDLTTTNLSLKRIAEKHKVSLSTVKRINKNKLRVYSQPDCTYIADLQHDLMFTSLTITELSEKYNISKSLVYFINNGSRHKNDILNYPLRQKSRA